jgi:hypothetical protein
MTGAHFASVIHRAGARNGFQVLAFFCRHFGNGEFILILENGEECRAWTRLAN